ncbi:MAG: alpha/beta fold hydrolase, partial [Saprospiraceae bacterium]|nr:alpha/beta fold hydrolase [Saprospiraceae bacterium]
ALHGFSDRARMFAVLEKSLSERYTTVAIDLPFHGQTEWRKNDFSKEDLLKIINQVLVSARKTRFSLLGFSFGARLAQGMLPELSPQLDKLFLLSPDGPNTKGMGKADCTPMWIRRFLFRMLRYPKWFVSLVGFGRNWGLIPMFTSKFLRANLNRPKRVKRIFGCWFSMDSFNIHSDQIHEVLQEAGLPVEVYVGAKDNLINKKSLKKIYEDLPNVHLVVLKNEGHRIVGKGLAEALRSGR